MSKFGYLDKIKFEKLFNMDSGYVMDFSDSTFRAFLGEEVGIDIYDEKYSYKSGSKANRIRGFWQIESNHKIAELLNALLDYWVNEELPRERNHYNAEELIYRKSLHQECRKIAEKLKLDSPTGIIVKAETATKLNHEFINEQIKKCNSKIEQSDFNGAITNARSFTEAIMIEIIEAHEKKEIKNTGNLENLYKQVKKILNLTISSEIMPDTVIKMLSGLDSITSSLAGLSNNSGDRHANKFKTQKHHAKLAVNSAMTLADFLLDSRKYQNNKKN